MATPLLTATPGAPPTYNPSMAETFSWVPVEGAGRPLFAQATYLANPEDIKVSLSANNINVSLDQLELNTDEIENLIRDSNTRLTTLTSQVLTINQNVSATNTRLTNIDTDLDTTNSRLQTLINQTDGIEGSVDGIEGLIGTTNTNTSNIDSNISTSNTRLQTLINQTSAVQPKLDTIIATLSNVPITQSTTPTLTSSLLITGQKRVYSIFGVSTSTNNQYIHIYNSSTSTPAGTPVAVFSIPANSNFSFDINKGLNFTSGCLVTNSLTLTSFSGGMNDLYFTVVHTS
jgi:ABC-type transporter Mla subunit MlaD